MNDFVSPPNTSRKSLLQQVEDALLPLINLVFLLLMFFILAGQLANEPLPELPGTLSGEQSETPEAHLIVTADGQWRVGQKPVNSDTLFSVLAERAEQAPLRIAAAENITMSDLERLFNLLEQDGHESVLLLTEPAS